MALAMSIPPFYLYAVCKGCIFFADNWKKILAKKSRYGIIVVRKL